MTINIRRNERTGKYGSEIYYKTSSVHIPQQFSKAQAWAMSKSIAALLASL